MAKKTTTKKKENNIKIKSASKDNEKPVVEVWLEQTYVHYTSRGPMMISAETHPVLEGMTLEEMKEYIKDNAYDLAPVDIEYCENIVEELREYDVVKDKYLDEEENLFFNN